MSHPERLVLRFGAALIGLAAIAIGVWFAVLFRKGEPIHQALMALLFAAGAALIVFSLIKSTASTGKRTGIALTGGGAAVVVFFGLVKPYIQPPSRNVVIVVLVDGHAAKAGTRIEFPGTRIAAVTLDDKSGGRVDAGMLSGRVSLRVDVALPGKESVVRTINLEATDSTGTIDIKESEPTPKSVVKVTPRRVAIETFDDDVARAGPQVEYPIKGLGLSGATYTAELFQGSRTPALESIASFSVKPTDDGESLKINTHQEILKALSSPARGATDTVGWYTLQLSRLYEVEPQPCTFRLGYIARAGTESAGTVFASGTDARAGEEENEYLLSQSRSCRDAVAYAKLLQRFRMRHSFAVRLQFMVGRTETGERRFDPSLQVCLGPGVTVVFNDTGLHHASIKLPGEDRPQQGVNCWETPQRVPSDSYTYALITAMPELDGTAQQHIKLSVYVSPFPLDRTEPDALVGSRLIPGNSFAGDGITLRLGVNRGDTAKIARISVTPMDPAVGTPQRKASHQESAPTASAGRPNG